MEHRLGGAVQQKPRVGGDARGLVDAGEPVAGTAEIDPALAAGGAAGLQSTP
jgi:hypothetical protein